jgi:hypothetical protein
MGSIEVGVSVRINGAVPGWGEALDRYGVVEKISIAHFKAFVRSKANAAWLRIEDITRVGRDE